MPQLHNSNHDFLANLEGLKERDVRRIEEQNRVLVGSVR